MVSIQTDPAAAEGFATEILVVSLADAADRRAAFADRARGANAAWRFVDAATGLIPALTLDEAAVRRNKGRALTKGEIGCYASHFAIWDDMVARGIAQVIVLEDDTIVDWAYLERLGAIDLAARGFDYLRLYAKRPTSYRVVAKDFLQHSRTVVELIGLAYGTQGYAITLKGARALAGECRVIRRPIDDAMDRSWAHGVRNLALVPAPILEATVPSAIGAARFTGKDDPAFHTVRQRAWRRLERMRMRLLKVRRILGR
ncbi:Glycosyltransferase family 25 (LPS biosynthesis protein) [Sphingomonas sp. EC-HK361]|uniref:glycosyltransferase family 25 protein n=1 Tax=Sphingomonas sp. EC-HK361 TaxID=2038397 RepID=UPI001258B529|nr:glycosyltransferase family 25 protein [Sphingomonas sp. EC-HK361]VVT00136.1 Glycosyltransferase family 25 (LPS biosynthesis protein) [Sphingomonas sp. EC-HK361]